MEKKLILPAIILCAAILLTPISFAWDDCPLGVTEPCTGQCSRFIDTNNDGICDHSQPAPTETSDASGMENTNDSQDNATVTDSQGNGAQKGKIGIEYYLLPLTGIFSLLYLTSYLVSGKRKAYKRLHKKIWNILLTLSYLITGITGLELALFINFGINSSLNQFITFWHAEASIVMVLTTLFHVHMYWKPVKRMFKLPRRSVKKIPVPSKNISPGK